jgi:hypothetical protein
LEKCGNMKTRGGIKLDRHEIISTKETPNLEPIHAKRRRRKGRIMGRKQSQNTVVTIPITGSKPGAYPHQDNTT